MVFSKEDKQAIAFLERKLPALRQTGYKITSPRTPTYNCIAWAAGDTSTWWWPTGKYWPGQVPKVATLSAFVMAYSLQGYEVCDARDLEAGFQKVAFYVGPDGLVTHAARQLCDGLWTSKMGPSFDITHTLEGLEGLSYGKIAAVLRRNAGQSN